MRNGWTGGQYSLLRIGFGTWLLVFFLGRVPDPVSLAALPALCFLFGWQDRIAAALLLLALYLTWPAALFDLMILVLHLGMPKAPFGSLDARGREDPGGGWRMPAAVFLAARLALIVAWVMVARGEMVLGGGLVVLHLLCVDPAWIRGVVPAGQEVLYYDPSCGLCHRSVRFVLAEDQHPQSLVFAPLGGTTFQDRVAAPDDLPDSVVIQKTNQELLLRSRAVLHLAARFGGYWRLLAWPMRVLPRRALDLVYDLVARVRHRLFARPKAACPLTPQRWRERFYP